MREDRVQFEALEYQALEIKGLPGWFVENTPPDFWTWEAFRLFQAAEEKGVIFFDLAGGWLPGAGYSKADMADLINSDNCDPQSIKPITKGQLAYFCKRASKRLHLNKGAHTNWLPFERLFGYKPQTMRRYLHNVEERGAATRLEDPYIDKFFDSVRIDSSVGENK